MDKWQAVELWATLYGDRSVFYTYLINYKFDPFGDRFV